MRDKDSHLISEAYTVVRESIVRTCSNCAQEFNIPRNPNATHGICRRHAKEHVDIMAKQFKYAPEQYKARIDKLNNTPDDAFSPDLAQQPEHKSLPVTEAKLIAKDIPPPYLNTGDNDNEIEIASKSAFTAYTHALQLGKHHPRLLNAVLGSPYEKLYKQQFGV